MNNYQYVEFATPDDYTGDPADIYSWMMSSGYAKKRYFGVGGLHTAKFGKFLGEIGIQSINMELKAEGVGRASEGGTYHMVPFSGQTKGRQYDYELKLIYATQLYDNPFGFKINYFRKNSKEPEGYLYFERNDSIYFRKPDFAAVLSRARMYSNAIVCQHWTQYRISSAGKGGQGLVR